jgi:hypothetical protein
MRAGCGCGRRLPRTSRHPPVPPPIGNHLHLTCKVNALFHIHIPAAPATLCNSRPKLKFVVLHVIALCVILSPQPLPATLDELELSITVRRCIVRQCVQLHKEHNPPPLVLPNSKATNIRCSGRDDKNRAAGLLEFITLPMALLYSPNEPKTAPYLYFPLQYVRLCVIS